MSNLNRVYNFKKKTEHMELFLKVFSKHLTPIIHLKKEIAC